MATSSSSLVLRVAASALLILAVLTPVWSLRCWVCTSEEGGYCGDKFNETNMWQNDCPAERRTTPSPHASLHGYHGQQPARHPVCKKVKQKERGQLVYLRSCGYEAKRGEACDSEGDRTFNDDVQFCETCETDGCNSAPQAAARTLGVVAAALSAAVLARVLAA